MVESAIATTQYFLTIDQLHCCLLYRKYLKKIILEQITTYLDFNNLIHMHQYGFRKNHSTEYAALHIVKYLNYDLDRNRTPTNVYLDLSKAFDTLSHNILLRKLKH